MQSYETRYDMGQWGAIINTLLDKDFFHFKGPRTCTRFHTSAVLNFRFVEYYKPFIHIQKSQALFLGWDKAKLVVKSINIARWWLCVWTPKFRLDVTYHVISLPITINAFKGSIFSKFQRLVYISKYKTCIVQAASYKQVNIQY